MLELKRTDSTDPDFLRLVIALDQDLAERNGDTNAFFAQYNKVDLIRNVVIAFIENIAVGCGAIKEYDPETMEIKRMFVLSEWRGKGVAAAVLKDLETWAHELAYTRCVLETGDKMPEAIRLYEKNNYKRIDNYGQYQGIESSLCFEKILRTWS